MALTDFILSGGDARKNLYVHVKDDPGVQKGVALWAGAAFASLLWLGVYAVIFGWFAPSGETVTIGTYTFTDHTLNAVSGASVPIFGAITVIAGWHLESVNRRQPTLPFLTREANKLFKRK